MRKVPLEFRCSINKIQFSISGHIQLVDEAGFCSATLFFDRKTLPSESVPELLSYLAITGYPVASYPVGSAYNPFAKTKNDFKTIRSLDLGKSGKLKTTCFSQNRGTDKEKLIFHVFGKVAIQDKIISISPLIEIWLPKGNSNSFSGEMTFTWKLKTGKILSGQASGEYNVKGENLPAPQMRVITFDFETSNNYFIQYETMRLYDLREWKGSIRKTA